MLQECKIIDRVRTNLTRVIIFLAIFCLGAVENAEAQSFYFAPDSAQHSVSSTFSAKLYLDSTGIAVNAAQATINFPPDLLEVKSISKDGSVFTLWPAEPSFSNTAGRISFSGGVPAPGVTGIGKILIVNFKVKKTGDAVLSITDGVLLKADGKGTNILKNAGSLVFTEDYKLTDKNALTEKNLPGDSNSNSASGGGPAEFSFSPSIVSSSHPDQKRWYNDPDIKINWKNSEAVKGVSVKLDKNNFSDPGSTSQGVFDSKNYDDTKDGIWFFHLKAKDQSIWSKTLNYKVQIDTVPPESFNIKIDNYGDLTSPQPSLYFETKDSFSGLEKYALKIDEENMINIETGKTNPFVLPIQTPGTHSLSVWAVDLAGNKTESRAELEIRSIQIPEITIYTKAYNAGEEILYLEGTSAPSSTVTIFFEGSGRTKAWQSLSDSEGKWSFLTDELFKTGTYNIYARAEDKRGAVSSSSAKQDVEVVLNGIAIGSYLVSYYSLLLVIAGFILLITLLMAYIYKKSKEEKIKITKEVDEARLSLDVEFKHLRNKITKKIEYFDDKSGLSAEEKRIKDEIMGILRSSEKIVEKEIKDIGDVLKKGRWMS